MDTQEMSPNLAQVACSLANQSHSGACPEVSEVTFETTTLESLEPDEMAALKAFLSRNYPLKRLLSNSDRPLIEDNWWGK
jgi:hypothetical protein